MMKPLPFGAWRGKAPRADVPSLDALATLELTISSLRIALAAERSARIADIARLERLLIHHGTACSNLTTSGEPCLGNVSP